MRFVAEFADEALHVGDAHAEGCAGLTDDVFLDHDAAEIVRAEAQRDLPDLESLRDPRALDVRHVVEVDAAEGLRAQILVRADGGGFEARVLGLERPRDERGEAAARVLLRADAFEMLDAVRDGLDVAEHHRGRRTQAEAVRDIHHGEPVVAHGLERRDAFAHAIDENFAAATGDRAKARGVKIGDDFFKRFVEDIAEVNELARAEAVNVHLRKLRFDVREQVEVPLLGKFRMMPALHENLRAAERDGFLDFAVHFVVRDDVGIVVTLDAVERAELAIHVANIGVIDVAIDDVSDDVVAASGVSRGLRQFAAAMRERAEFLERQMIQAQRLGGRDPAAGPHLLEKIIEDGVVDHGIEVVGVA